MNLTQEQWRVLKPPILAAVENELASGTTPETSETLERLVRQGYSKDEALDLIARVFFRVFLVPECEGQFLAEKYGTSVTVRADFDGYRRALRALPRL
jgi:hypothetical protein